MRKRQQGRRALRQADQEREQLLEQGQVHGGYVPPDRDVCNEFSFYMPWDDEATILLEQRTWVHEKRVADFHLTASTMILLTAEWESVDLTRADICHGHAHGHYLWGPKKNTDVFHIMRIDTIDDVQVALRRSSEMMGILASRIREGRGDSDV